ncbi:MAG: 6-phosphofructokinase [Clostridia bacterium]|nr:6-phosphofructokinase [Clostridia bacterium]
MKGNVIVGQSGGPTAVINASLAGVFKTAMERGYNKVYGMRYGILGFLDEQYVDLSDYIKNELDLELLKKTPSCFLGSCRFKLPGIHEDQELYKKIFSLLDKLNIEIFIYIGGNDSMDTIKKLSDYALLTGAKQRFVGCPKTIDNDLAITDHTPGFGSAAKYIATSTKEVIQDAMAFSYKKKNVTILEIMGRNAGWLVGSTALSRQEDCNGPDLIYLPEVPLDPDAFIQKVKDFTTIKKSVVIAVSEGVKLPDGTLVCELGNDAAFVDAFGHRQLSGAGKVLTNMIAENVGYKTRTIEFSILQRCATHLASRVDIDEAYNVGYVGCEAVMNGETGKMITIEVLKRAPYVADYGIHDIHDIANVEKKVPDEWIIRNGTYVSNEFREYCHPLVLGSLSKHTAGGIPKHMVL